MTTAVQEPETIRKARERIEQLDALVREARDAIEEARTSIETAKARREAARARGDHDLTFQLDQAILDAEATIAARELQIRRLRPERESLPAVLVDYDRRRHEADRLREQIEGVERLVELNRTYRALAAECEAYRLNAKPGAPGIHAFPWLEEVRRTGTTPDYDWHLELSRRCLARWREQLAELEGSLSA